jgi:uncharacterized protein YuzB (UPF0349 family)
MLNPSEFPSRLQVQTLLKGLTLLGCAFLVSCSGTSPTPTPLAASGLPVTLTSQPLNAPTQPCANTFVAHQLDHTTTIQGETVHLYDSNGSGLAINDFDNDGKPDVVLANLNGPNTLLWNQGHLNFRTERLSDNPARAVNAVDVDGDGWQDLVFTHDTTPPTYWHNTGDGHFTQDTLPEITAPAYTMNWADLNGDGALDVVLATYDDGLKQVPSFDWNKMLSLVGVNYYERHGQGFTRQQLAKGAQALAIAFPDLDADGHLDVLVGNDFEQPDEAWRYTTTGWVHIEPFATKMTQNTMSFDVGDVNNDGQPEIFASDMKPYQSDVKTMATWLPLMDYMNARHPPQAKAQIVENVLQVRSADGRYSNEGYARSVDATGWSWSSKFGDLDNDGFLDIYVVNGMISEELLSHLPNDELVEENQAMRNKGNGYFAPAPEWGLGSRASGRGMSMADLDSDGDLDIVINNLRSPAQLFENQLCGGSGLEVDLFWPTGGNTRALGAQLILRTSAGGTYYRDVRAASGYLSGDPARVHFGFPTNATLQKLEIRWPDGQTSILESPTPQTLITITR